MKMKIITKYLTNLVYYRCKRKIIIDKNNLSLYSGQEHIIFERDDQRIPEVTMAYTQWHEIIGVRKRNKHINSTYIKYLIVVQ